MSELKFDNEVLQNFYELEVKPLRRMTANAGMIFTSVKCPCCRQEGLAISGVCNIPYSLFLAADKQSLSVEIQGGKLLILVMK